MTKRQFQPFDTFAEGCFVRRWWAGGAMASEFQKRSEHFVVLVDQTHKFWSERCDKCHASKLDAIHQSVPEEVTPQEAQAGEIWMDKLIQIYCKILQEPMFEGHLRAFISSRIKRKVFDFIKFISLGNAWTRMRVCYRALAWGLSHLQWRSWCWGPIQNDVSMMPWHILARFRPCFSVFQCFLACVPCDGQLHTR